MPRPSLSETDLLLGQKALEDIVRARQSRGVTQPLSDVIDAAAGAVADHAGHYDLPADRWRRLVRALAVRDLLTFPGGAAPAAVEAAAHEALQELRDIRDGKFASLLPANPAPPVAPPRTAFGSADPILPGSQSSLLPIPPFGPVPPLVG